MHLYIAKLCVDKYLSRNSNIYMQVYATSMNVLTEISIKFCICYFKIQLIWVS